MSALRPDRPVRRHRWRRRVIAVALALVVALVLVAVAVRLYVGQQHAAAPLSLPGGQAAAATGPVAGTWHAAAGSVAGFRVDERALGASNVVVGRTSAVTGTIVADGSTVSRAAFQVTLTTIRVGGKPQPQLAASLRTGAHPVAEIRLVGPLELSTAFADGSVMHASVRGLLTLNGLSHPVTISLDTRRDGAGIQAAGSIPVSFASWRISQPAGFGWFGSLADHGTAEFLVILHRA
jgi:polyisoprenoid-binding protein YceI